MSRIVNSYHSSFNGGIGDFLRGSISLYERCSKNNIDFAMDFSKHPVSKYLRTPYNHSYSEDYILDFEHLYLKNPNRSSNWLAEIKRMLDMVIDQSIYSNEDIIVASNYIECLQNVNFFRSIKYFEIDTQTIKFMQNSMIFDQSINKAYDKLKLHNYVVVHYRLGDYHSLPKVKKHLKNKDIPEEIKQNYNTRNFNHDYEQYYENIKKYLDTKKYDKIIVMSDCNSFKRFIKKQKHPSIKILHTKSTHTSIAPGFLKYSNYKNELTDEKIFNTVLDLKILSNSQKNVSHSVYKWGSGFVVWPSKIFNIPLEMHNIYD